ncbi:MAG: mechanosensitive ion channel protein MscS [Roseobacter sp.]|uniref:Mechanosensitive ion channel domain-containing protein n=1 Tax=Sulfitobacter sp. TCYB15 TaxID=3229275 RepID=A0AAU8C5M4_9RHOB|nr:mechanosensitive ion channel domain-containing protein [uncultured Sulfitobacter sp.]MBG62535.1 mechanosensitive ion channel protein MscS [Roseobacter sp.]
MSKTGKIAMPTQGWLYVLTGLVVALFLTLAPFAAQAQSLFTGGGSSDTETTETTPEAEAKAPLDTLLEVLKDDDARAALIADLEKSLDASGDPAGDENPAIETITEAADAEGVSVGRQIALITQQIGQDTVSTLTSFWNGFERGGKVFSGLSGAELTVLLEAIPGLLAVIAITVALFVVLRYLARGLYARMGRTAEHVGLFRSIGLFLGSNLLDAFIVVVAWAAGYLITILAVGEVGQIGIRQSMYLNAFLLVEMTKVVIRSFLSPVASGLRLVPVGDKAAAALTRYLSIVVSVLGYGQLLVVPIVNQSVNTAAGAGVSALLSVLVLLYFVYIVLRRRKAVTRWLQSEADPSEAQAAEGVDPATIAEARRGFIARTLHGLAGIWHWFALAYIAVMFIVVMTQPAEVTLNAIVGSGKILAAIIIAALLSGWLAQAVHRGISLPEDVNAKLPLLERRINTFVPRAFSALRLFLLVCVLFFTLDVIGTIDMRSWLEGQVGLAVTKALISVGLILTVAFGIWLALTSFVDYKLNPEYGAVPTSRETTLLTLLRNAATITLIILTLMFVLSEIGLDIGPLLASAGVLGLAIGFGAQKMVQDIITGVFIQFENVINVGDVITVGGTTGTVEKLSVRSVSLRDVQGAFHMIPFSTVDVVSNYMRGFSYTVCDMGIAYRENVEEAKQAMFDAFDRMMENEPEIANSIMGELEWFGVQSLGDSAVVLRVRIKTDPGKQWGIGRMYNGYLKTVFDERGIEIPFPQQTIWLGENKDGTTQPFKIEGPAAQDTSLPPTKTVSKPIEADDVPDSDDADGDGGADR